MIEKLLTRMENDLSTHPGHGRGYPAADGHCH